MTPEQMEAVTRKHAELWSAHDADGVAALYAEDCVYEDMPTGLVLKGKRELIGHASRMFAMIPNITVNLRSVSASGTHCAREYTITGTHAETGGSISLPGVSILEFRGEEIVRNTDYYDLSSFLRQVTEQGDRSAQTS
jgi:steroid delta-isomerase-like uncharacterized protein